MIVEDHAIMREGLSLIIATQPDMAVVAGAGSAEEAIELFRRHEPDVTLVDLRLPGMSGACLIATLRRQYPAARFIVLTTYDGDADIHAALQSGAQAYLLKGMSRESLLEAIRSVHDGRKCIPAAIATRLAEHVYDSELSSRELEVLDLIVKGLSNREIATRLEITEFTVKYHVKSILSKLGVRDRTQALSMALQRGIVHLS
jgi:DNA-binding NarL/FixJ family response regulator